MTPDPPRIDRECVEAYLYAEPPFELLLFRRPPSRGRVWVPVSGKVEPEDADFGSAVRREVAEETGLRLDGPLLDLDWHVPFEVTPGVWWRLHAYAARIPRVVSPRLSSEHETSEWVPAAEAVERLHYEDNREAVRRLAARLGLPPPGRPT